MSKVCEVCAGDSSIELLWSCVACARSSFHPSCAGIMAPRGSLRFKKSDKKTVDPSSLLLPCCESCQTLVTTTFEFNALAEQQKLLTKQVSENTEIMYRLSKQCERPSDFQLIMESIETLLNGLKDQMASMQKKHTVDEMLRTRVDVSMEANTNKIHSAINAVTAELKTDLRSIKDDLCQLNQMSVESAACYNMNTNSMLGIDILDELKILSSNINTIQHDKMPSTTSDSLPSLEAELNSGKSENVRNTSGWRFVGSSKCWRADWTDFDRRKAHRIKQQKQADTARKRKQQRRAQNYPINKNINYNANNYKNSRRNNNNSNYRNEKNKNNNNINNHSSSDVRNKTFQSTRNNNYNNNSQNRNNIPLPPDRILLAAAKERFAKPPVSYQPTVQFERGEILNPYPTTSATNHRVEQPYTSQQHCSSCSCNNSCFRPT